MIQLIIAVLPTEAVAVYLVGALAVGCLLGQAVILLTGERGV